MNRVLITLLLSWFVVAKLSAAEKPNVLLIITDQQHAKMMSCAGNPHVKTPAMDRLASRGVRFERAYCANPVCIPSRFSMMTGVLPSRIGMEKNGRAEVSEEILSHAMGSVFRRHGYSTVYGGKVHLPGDRTEGITAYGFEYLIDDEREELAEACAAFLRQKHEQPFLLVASFINPHDICYMAIDAYTEAASKPLMYPNSERERQCLAESLRLPAGMSRVEFFETVCPPLPANFEIPEHEPPATRGSDWREFRQYVQEKWSEEQWRLHRWAYARLTERVDQEIGVVLDALEETDLTDDTIVVFTSDHGDMDSAHRLEHKSMPYEEATNVPLIVCTPQSVRAGRVDKSHLVSTGLDLIPTLCDFAGIPAPKQLDNCSIRPLVRDAATDAPWRKCLVAENEASRVLWSDDYKYVVYDQGQPREMLIDLRADPGEMRNLAVEAEFQTALNKHRKLLQQWYASSRESLDPKYVVGEGQ